MMSSRSRLSSRTTFFLVTSSTLTVCTLRFLQWRARKRAREAAERASRVIPEGPLIDINDEEIKLKILNRAIRRAFKWLSYHVVSDNRNVQPMVGQVGGISARRRPVLTMRPDYVMKPLHSDHRGYREVAVYEAIRLSCQTGTGYHQVAAAMAGQEQETTTATTGGRRNNNAVSKRRTLADGILKSVDVLAMLLAIVVRDREVTGFEEALVNSWKATKREIDLLRRLSNFTPSYYGVVKNSVCCNYDDPDMPPSVATEMGEDSYLLLSDVTANYSKPCVIDIKMGKQTYEPDATEDKRIYEHKKYPQQATFGFRIVGMRIYEPTHSDADKNGYRCFGKMYGKTLATRESILDAFRMFFSSGLPDSPEAEEGDSKEAGSDEHPNKMPRIRVRAMTNLLMLMRHLRRWFDENDSLCFYASSLLIVYDGDSRAQDRATLKMIDLGHTRRERGGDHGYTFGLRSLMAIIVELIEESS